jgi:hypothetical protein
MTSILGYMRPEDIGSGNFWCAVKANSYYHKPVLQAPIKVYLAILNNGEPNGEYFEWVVGIFYKREDAEKEIDGYLSSGTVEEWEVK